MASGETLARRPARRLRFAQRKSTADAIFDVLNGLFLILLCLTVVYPFWVTLLTSFADAKEATSLGLHVWIGHWYLDAYKFALSKYGNVPTAYLNSIHRTVIGTVLTVLVVLLGAYPLSKRELPGRGVMTVYLLVTMFFSGGLIPSYLLIRNLGLYDSRWALILPGMAGAYNIIIVRNFLMTVDKAFEEAAFIEGANYLQILIRVMIPLSKPVIATVALWTAVGHWNAWFDALIYLNTESKIVLQLLLRRLMQEMTLLAEQMNRFGALDEKRELPSEGVKAAITILTIGPIVAAYPFLQKYFIKGIFMGSLKG
jgi:putative aldouronate transport system permease protein